MRVQVQHHFHVVPFPLNVVFDRVNDRVMDFVGRGPPAVGVRANKLRAGVAVDDAVHVYHRDDFEGEVVEQVPGSLAWRKEEVDEPLKHEPRGGLAWVLTGDYPH